MRREHVVKRTVLTSAGHGTYVVSAAVAVDVDVVTSVVETEWALAENADNQTLLLTDSTDLSRP